MFSFRTQRGIGDSPHLRSWSADFWSLSFHWCFCICSKATRWWKSLASYSPAPAHALQLKISLIIHITAGSLHRLIGQFYVDAAITFKKKKKKRAQYKNGNWRGDVIRVQQRARNKAMNIPVKAREQYSLCHHSSPWKKLIITVVSIVRADIWTASNLPYCYDVELAWSISFVCAWEVSCQGRLQNIHLKELDVVWG